MFAEAANQQTCSVAKITGQVNGQWVVFILEPIKKNKLRNISRQINFKFFK